jgi:hypothetical protein
MICLSNQSGAVLACMGRIDQGLNRVSEDRVAAPDLEPFRGPFPALKPRATLVHPSEALFPMIRLRSAAGKRALVRPNKRHQLSEKASSGASGRLVREERGSALLEFAITLPLLVVFVVGIYDFSGAFNQKQKIEQAAQEGSIVAGAQPTSDIASTISDPESLHPVVIAVFNSLAGSGVLPNGGLSCTPVSPSTPVPAPPAPPSLTWTYTISGCSSAFGTDNLVIAINRGLAFTASSPASVGTMVTVTYPYHWRFNSVVQLLVPGASYLPMTSLTESATVHNQM